MKNLQIKTSWVLTVGTVLLPMAGSAQKPDTSEWQNPAANDVENKMVFRVMHAQTASGARDDSTLYPQHFDGQTLSSLGIAKLDLMLADSHSCNPLTVYLDLGADPQADARRIAVNNYLQDRGGLKPEQIQFVDGANPDMYHPAAPDLKNYQKTDTSAGGGGYGGPDTSASSSSGSGTSSGTSAQ